MDCHVLRSIRTRRRVSKNALYGRKMVKPMTPKELGVELGVSDRSIRQWLRDQGWQSVPYARWELTEEQAAKVRAHFR
jgi:uncharacterized protein YjcR